MDVYISLISYKSAGLQINIYMAVYAWLISLRNLFGKHIVNYFLL